MPKLSEANGNAEAIEALRGQVYVHVLPGLWQGGRLYVNAFGEEIFIPVGKKRTDVGITTPLTFVGDAVKNLRGWSEVYLTNPVVGVIQ